MIDLEDMIILTLGSFKDLNSIEDHVLKISLMHHPRRLALGGFQLWPFL